MIDLIGLEKAVCVLSGGKKELYRLVSDIPQGDPQHVLGQSIA